jgi:hypothetical protein
MFVRSHCRLHCTHINRLYTIPSIVAGYYKSETKYCCCLATCLSGHMVDFTTHTSTVCIRYQVLLAAYYKAETKYCCCLATCLSGHIVDFTTHTSTVYIRYKVLLAAYYKAETKYCCCRVTYLSGHMVDFTAHTSTVCIRYQVLLAAYYKADTKYCCCPTKRRQFPIRLAFPMTIKSQGQTFDKTCFYLLKPVFSLGQLYVALSTVRSLGSLSVVSETNGIVNCVYNEIYE